MNARAPLISGVLLVIAAMALCVQARLPGGLITVAALGLPVLFLMYQQQSGVYRNIPRRAVLITVVLAIGLAVVWVLLTGDLVVREAGSAFDEGIAGRRVLRDGLGVAEGGALLMLVPTVATRLLWRGPRKSRDGMAIGIVGALVFTATATLTRLAPQFATGVISRNPPVPWLLFEAATRGLTVPLTAACAGGLTGLALWFRRPADGSGPSRAAFVAALAAFGVVVLGIFAAVGRFDIEGVPQPLMLAWHVGMALVALIVLRLGVHLALSRESRESAGHEYHPSTFAAKSWARVLGAWTAVMVAAGAVMIGIPALTVKPPARYNCPPECGRPVTGAPAAANPRYTAADEAFSVEYPAPGSGYQVSTRDDGVIARSPDGSVMGLLVRPADGRSAEDVATAFLNEKFPGAVIAYRIPNAMVGYQPGYGAVADLWSPDPNTSPAHKRIVVMVSVKNDLAGIAGGAGPYQEFTPDFGPGHPSGANLWIAQDVGSYANTFRWRGDPAR